MNNAYMYSIRSGELIIRKGEIMGTEFIYYFNNQEGHRKMRVYDTVLKDNREPHDAVFLPYRDDKKGIQMLVDRQKEWIKRETERIQRLNERLSYLEEKLEQA